MKDGRTIAGKRRAMAVRKATDVMLELLREALRAGHQAKYVLFDTWFANPHQIVLIKDMGLDVIAMVKKSSKIQYEYEGKRLNAKQIFKKSKKRRGRECRNSGLTDYQWCKQKGISTNTLYRWINKFRQNGYPDIPKARNLQKYSYTVLIAFLV